MLVPVPAYRGERRISRLAQPRLSLRQRSPQVNQEPPAQRMSREGHRAEHDKRCDYIAVDWSVRLFTCLLLVHVQVLPGCSRVAIFHTYAGLISSGSS